MKPALFVDSWGWISLANPRDPFHKTVSAFYRNEKARSVQIITTEYVLDEVITFLYAKGRASLVTKYLQAIFSSGASGNIQLERIAEERFDAAWQLRLKYQDHPDISFTDFTSFVVMRELGIQRVLTNDRHFTQVNLGLVCVP